MWARQLLRAATDKECKRAHSNTLVPRTRRERVRREGHTDARTTGDLLPAAQTLEPEEPQLSSYTSSALLDIPDGGTLTYRLSALQRLPPPPLTSSYGKVMKERKVKRKLWENIPRQAAPCRHMMGPVLLRKSTRTCLRFRSPGWCAFPSEATPPAEGGVSPARRVPWTRARPVRAQGPATSVRSSWGLFYGSGKAILLISGDSWCCCCLFCLSFQFSLLSSRFSPWCISPFRRCILASTKEYD